MNARSVAAVLLLAGVPFALARAQAPAPAAAMPATPAAPAAESMPGMDMPTMPAPGTEEKGKRKSAPADAYCYIGWPNDGEVIHSTRFKVWFGTRNFGVAPAGTNVPGTGHHHLLIDTDLPNLDEPIPNDRNHLHYGLGQTETIIELPPGRHTLQLLMGDGNHLSFDPPVMSKKITITVAP